MIIGKSYTITLNGNMNIVSVLSVRFLKQKSRSIDTLKNHVGIKNIYKIGEGVGGQSWEEG